MKGRTLCRARNVGASIVLALALAMSLSVGMAFAADEIGTRKSFYGDSGFTYLGYSSMSHINGYFDSTQRTQCTSTSAPIGNMKSTARLTTNGYSVVSSKAVTNTSTYSRYSNLTATTNAYNNTQFGYSLMGAGISSCWKSGGWYDVLTGATSLATKSVDGNCSDIEVNLSGQICGTIFDAEEGVPIDLVKAYTTDGLKGYVYFKELKEAENRGMDTPEEAAITMAERRSKSAEAIKNALDANFAEQSEARYVFEATTVDGEAILDAYCSVLSEGISPKEDSFMSAVKDAIPRSRALVSLSVVDEAVLEKSINDAWDAVREYIPVYAEDGTTIIGKYPIDSLL